LFYLIVFDLEAQFEFLAMPMRMITTYFMQSTAYYFHNYIFRYLSSVHCSSVNVLHSDVDRLHADEE